MTFKHSLSFFCLILPLALFAQFAPQAGLPGSSAISADSNVFVNWASGFSLQRSWQNLSDTSLGKVTAGEEWSITGKAGNGVISLGDGGSITLTFPYAIRNGTGADFAIFENGFKVNDSLAFLELAFVEVSTNGNRFVRFPAQYIGSNQQIGAFTGADARNYHNLAGKYIFGYGTPFDLEELKDSSGLDVNNIQFVKIIDVKGAMSELGTKDIFGNYINDPWPTPFPSAGFDFDAVGVIYQNDGLSLNEQFTEGINLFPNPAKVGEAIHFSGFGLNQINVYNLKGELICAQHHPSKDLHISTPGLYLVECIGLNENQTMYQKLMITP
jgi:hypothetical protein